MSQKAKKYLFKTVCLTIGCFINYFGLSLAIRAGFGASTFTVLLGGVGNTLGITIGQASWVVAAAVFSFCFFYSRNQIKAGTAIVVLLNGLLLDFFGAILVYPESRILCFLLMNIGLVITSIGAAVIAFANFGRGSYEALTFAFVERQGWQVRWVRIVLDICLVTVGSILGGKAGLCTICTIPICGPVIQLTLKWLKRLFPGLAAMGINETPSKEAPHK